MTITLNSYILADGIAADQTAKTDARGKVVFDNLTAGIYLVSSVRTEQDGKYYVFESFLAAVPGVDSEGQWVYSVSARPKMSVHTPAKGVVTYKAVKPGGTAARIARLASLWRFAGRTAAAVRDSQR